jgi:fumarate hydratase subunit beta
MRARCPRSQAPRERIQQNKNKNKNKNQEKAKSKKQKAKSKRQKAKAKAKAKSKKQKQKMEIMAGNIELSTPLTDETLESLRIGDIVRITGDIFTGRDAAHKRLVECLDRGEALPVDLRGQIIYFTGPTPPPPGRPIGAVGPTTSYRMDAYSPRLIAEAGLKAMIGKGARSQPVVDAMIRHKCVYLAAVGGAGALLALHVTGARVVAYEDLGPEAIRCLTVEHFPAIVVNDITGADLYKEGFKPYRV